MDNVGTLWLLAMSDLQPQCNSVGTSRSHLKLSTKRGQVDVLSQTPEIYYRHNQRGKE